MCSYILILSFINIYDELEANFGSAKSVNSDQIVHLYVNLSTQCWKFSKTSFEVNLGSAKSVNSDQIVHLYMNLSTQRWKFSKTSFDAKQRFVTPNLLEFGIQYQALYVLYILVCVDKL